jgi:hypothetical protein
MKTGLKLFCDNCVEIILTVEAGCPVCKKSEYLLPSEASGEY